MNKVKKIKNIVMQIALICSILGIIWACGKLLFHDIPTLIMGYEETVIESEEDDDKFGISYESPTKTVKKSVEFADALSMVIENLMLGILSAGVLIAYPAYKEYEAND